MYYLYLKKRPKKPFSFFHWESQAKKNVCSTWCEKIAVTPRSSFSLSFFFFSSFNFTSSCEKFHYRLYLNEYNFRFQMKLPCRLNLLIEIYFLIRVRTIRGSGYYFEKFEWNSLLFLCFLFTKGLTSRVKKITNDSLWKSCVDLARNVFQLALTFYSDLKKISSSTLFPEITSVFSFNFQQLLCLKFLISSFLIE